MCAGSIKSELQEAEYMRQPDPLSILDADRHQPVECGVARRHSSRGTEKMINEENKVFFKQLLTDRLHALLGEANKTVTGMTDQSHNFPDPTDRASMESDRNFELRIRDRERRLINKIKEALDRIELGTYGICEDCGEDISAERLEARPVTTLCIDCKKKQEDEERLKGF